MSTYRDRTSLKHALAGLTPKQKRAALRRGETEMARLAALRRTERTRKRALGEVPFPGDPLRYNWFVLVTAANQERKSAARLYQAGFAAYVPYAQVEARQSRTMHGKRHMTRRPLLTSMVVAGFDAANTPPWLYVLDREQFPELYGVIAFNGQPARLPFDGLFKLKALDGMQDRTRHYTPLVGDTVRILDDVFLKRFGDNFEGVVTAVDDGFASVEIKGLEGLFGGTARAETAVMTFSELDLEQA
mgnify:CR=1 FL=1